MHVSQMFTHSLPYANLVQTALHLCDTMLSRSDTLYPFAVLRNDDDDVQMVFAEYSNQFARPKMIEELEQQLQERSLHRANSIALIAYAASIQSENGEDHGAIVLNITDASGDNTITIYPYKKQATFLDFGTPFTCNFTD